MAYIIWYDSVTAKQRRYFRGTMETTQGPAPAWTTDLAKAAKIPDKDTAKVILGHLNKVGFSRVAIAEEGEALPDSNFVKKAKLPTLPPDPFQMNPKLHAERIQECEGKLYQYAKDRVGVCEDVSLDGRWLALRRDETLEGELEIVGVLYGQAKLVDAQS